MSRNALNLADLGLFLDIRNYNDMLCQENKRREGFWLICPPDFIALAVVKRWNISLCYLKGMR
jgi:hypothetical protein